MNNLNNLLSPLGSDSYIKLPRVLVEEMFNYPFSISITWVYLWMLVHAAYGKMNGKHGIINRGDVEMNRAEFEKEYNLPKGVIYRIIESLIKLGLIEKRKHGYHLKYYDQHCGGKKQVIKLMDQTELKGSFREFWIFYHYMAEVEMVDEYKTHQLWLSLCNEEREMALQYIDTHVKKTRNIPKRKSAYNYLKDKSYYTTEE